MGFLDRTELDTAFVRTGTPMASEIIDRIDNDNTLSDTRRRDLVSGLRRVARALGRPPQDVPADPTWLQPRLAKILPASLGISQKSWTNAVSDAKSALAHAGVIERTRNSIEDLAPEWRLLWRAVLDSKDPTLQPSLCRFVHFLNRHGVMPQDVSDSHHSAFRRALEANEISKNPDVPHRAAVNGWNLAAQRLDLWPQQVLCLPNRTNHIALPLEAFPASFAEDLEAWCGGLAVSDLLGIQANSQPLSDTSIRLYRGKVLKFASVLVHAGRNAEEIVSLANLVDPVQVEAGLRWLLARNANTSSQDIATIAGLLARIGRDHARLPNNAQARLDDMARRLKLQRTRGMTGKNRERLRALDTPETIRKLLALPETLQNRIGAALWTYKDALMSEDAIAIGILLYCPIRRKNISRIHLDRNLHRPGDGRVFLVFEPEEVKNRQRIEFELPPPLVKMIDRHIAKRSPLLCPPGTSWLFPKRAGHDAMDLSHFGDRVKKRIAREIGVTMNVHLFRHLAAKLFLDARPGAYEVVRHLLGHSSLSETLAAYVGFEAGTATRLFADVLGRARSQ